MSYLKKIGLAILLGFFLLRGGGSMIIAGWRFILPAVVLFGIYYAAKKTLLKGSSEVGNILICEKCGCEDKKNHTCVPKNT